MKMAAHRLAQPLGLESNRGDGREVQSGDALRAHSLA